MSARFEYAQVEMLPEVQALAADGWRVVSMAVVPARHASESASAVYLLERPVFLRPDGVS